jgi:lysophospholipase L1-like esterase
VSGITRREFVGTASIVGAGAALGCVHAGQAAGTAAVAPRERAVPLGATLLFQGDSITDAGRDRGDAAPNDLRALGMGYPLLLAGALLAAYPDRELRVFNRGTSGDTVPRLAGRWEQDAIALKPTVLSVLIGVNDYWNTRRYGSTATAGDYEQQYGALLGDTRQKVPGVRLVVMEPFVLVTGAVDESWVAAFDERRAAAARGAARVGATYVTLQRELETAAARGGGPGYWLVDGVHPTPAGYALIAERWRTVVGW